MSSGPAAPAVEVLLLQLDAGLEPPAYAHPGDAGADLRCTEDFLLGPGQRRLVGTGVAVALPDGYAAFVHPRSGLAARHGVTLVNAPGTVDAGYRGEIKVCLLNTDPRAGRRLHPGGPDRPAGGPAGEPARFVPVDELPASVRGSGGHGSTGGILSTSSQQSGASMTVPGETA